MNPKENTLQIKFAKEQISKNIDVEFWTKELEILESENLLMV